MVDECAPESNKKVSEQLVLDFVSSHLQWPAPTLPRLDYSFPEDFANQLAAAETYNKHLYRPNTYLHKWWARRCGTTFRLILKQLVADEARQDFYSPGGLEGRIVLDPMMGGGTTLHEAIRLGAWYRWGHLYFSAPGCPSQHHRGEHGHARRRDVPGFVQPHRDA